MTKLVIVFTLRLLDVIHNEKKLYLVFEYLNHDLKKYLDSQVPSTGITMPLVKVCIIKYYQNMFFQVIALQRHP